MSATNETNSHTSGVKRNIFRKLPLTVFGATGNQGGSVINTILSNETLAAKYRLRAVTRDVTSSSAKTLAARGCAVVQANMYDVPSFQAAVQGSYAVFAMTNYYDSTVMSQENEVRQGKNVADACKWASVRHFIFSTVPSGSKTSGGSIANLQHFHSKAEVSDYIEEIKKDSNMITTHYLPAVFMDIVTVHTVRGPDGTLTCITAMDPAVTLWPLIDIRADTGKWVASILEAGEAADGARVQAVGEWLRIPEIMRQFSKALGREVRYQHVSEEEYDANVPETLKGYHELSTTMLFVQDYGKGMEEKQYELGDKWLMPGMEKTTWVEYVKHSGPWQW